MVVRVLRSREGRGMVGINAHYLRLLDWTIASLCRIKHECRVSFEAKTNFNAPSTLET